LQVVGQQAPLQDRKDCGGDEAVTNGLGDGKVVQATESFLHLPNPVLKLWSAGAGHGWAPDAEAERCDMVITREGLTIDQERQRIWLRCAKLGLLDVEAAIRQSIKVRTSLQCCVHCLNPGGLQGNIIQVDGGKHPGLGKQGRADSLQAVQGKHTEATALLNGGADQLARLGRSIVAGVCEHELVIVALGQGKPLR
jgi:hypothetical protein